MKNKLSEKIQAVTSGFRKTKGADNTESLPKPKPKKQKGKAKILWIVSGAVLILIAVPLLVRANTGPTQNVVVRADLSLLTYGDIENTISATGTVESNNSYMVYSSQNYKVDEVLAEVGDYVTADQLLCTLDTSSLENQIETKETSMNTSANSSGQQVKTARDTYNAANNSLENGTNSSIINAESSVRTTYENWQKAQKTYNDYISSMDEGTNSSLVTQDNAVNSARATMESAQNSYDSACADADSAKHALDSYHFTPASQAELDAAQTALGGAILDQQLKQTAYESALSSYQSEQTAYQTTLDNHTNGLADDTDLNNAEAALLSAKQAYDDAANELQDAKDYTDTAQATLASFSVDTRYQELQAAYNAKRSAVDGAEKTLNSARSGYDQAVRSRNAAYSSADNTLADYAINVDTTYAAYQSALRSNDAATASAETSLQSNKNSLSSAQISANNDLAKLELSQLQESLDDTKILAGEEGTVTAVYASVGSSGSGLLFVIEDVDDLVIETTISEYDIGTVKVGMPVTIKSEATGDEVYQGTILSIAPTSNKTSQGTTDTSGDAVFAAKVKVDSRNTGLRIGMSVRLKFIVEQQEQVLAVPYDAVYTNDQDQECVLSIDTQTDGSLTVREIPVITGLENDISIVVSGDGISEGMQILSSPDSYKWFIGKVVIISDTSAASTTNSPMGMGFPMGG